MSTIGDIARGAGIGAGLWIGGWLIWRAMGNKSASTVPVPEAKPSEWVPPVAQSNPIIAPAILQLMRDLDARWPARSRSTDGTLPGAAHHEANPNSDHETGDAFDITRDRTSGPNLYDLADAVRMDPRVKYVIFDGRIANPAMLGGAWRPYEPSQIQHDRHTEHLHVSILHAKRDEVAPWNLSAVRTGEHTS